MGRMVTVRRSQYGGWAMWCNKCPDAWDFDRWPVAIRAAHIHARFHASRRKFVW